MKRVGNCKKKHICKAREQTPSVPAAAPPISRFPVCFKSRVSCLIEHFVVCGTASFSPLRKAERRTEACLYDVFANLPMLVQSVVRDPRHRSNRELNLVPHFHVRHSCLWYTTWWRFISIQCRCCAVNMQTNSLHAFVEHPLPQCKCDGMPLARALYLWQLFYGLQSVFFLYFFWAM